MKTILALIGGIVLFYWVFLSTPHISDMTPDPVTPNYLQSVERLESKTDISIPSGYWVAEFNIEVDKSQFLVKSNLYISSQGEFSLDTEVAKVSTGKKIKGSLNGLFMIKGSVLIAKDLIGDEVLIPSNKKMALSFVGENHIEFVNADDVSKIIKFIRKV